MHVCPRLRQLSATQSHLAAMDTNETTQYQANTSEARGLPKAAAFVLECLARMPQAFQVALGHPMLLQPFTEVTKRHSFACIDDFACFQVLLPKFIDTTVGQAHYKSQPLVACNALLLELRSDCYSGGTSPVQQLLIGKLYDIL